MAKVLKLVSFPSKLYQRLSSRLVLPEKWKGGRIETWVEYWKQVGYDYKTVLAETAKDCKAKPLKASIVGTGLLVGYIALNTNPDELVFREQLTNANIDLLLVGDLIRNPESEGHVKFLNSCANAGLLRKLSLGFFSVMWVGDYHPDCRIFGAQCSFLKPKYLTFYQRVIDVGCFGEWFVLRGKMLNYDVNPLEWEEIK